MDYMTKLANWRHGDVALIGISKLPVSLKESNTNIFMSKGSGGHDHTFKGGKFYPKVKGNNVIGYIRAKDTVLYHEEHSPKGVPIANGVYEIRKQNEFTHEGLREVID